MKIDKDRDTKATAGGKGEEEHQIHKGEPSADVGNRVPLRVVMRKRNHPPRGYTTS